MARIHDIPAIDLTHALSLSTMGSTTRPRGGPDVGDRHPGPRWPGRSDRRQPAGGDVLRRRGARAELRHLWWRAARHAGVVVHPRRRPPIRVRCDIERADAILCFDATLLEGRLLAAADERTLIVVNSGRSRDDLARALPGYRFVPVDAIAIARRTGLGRIVNSALLGAFACAVAQPPLAALQRTIRERSPRLTDENLAACAAGYEAARRSPPTTARPQPCRTTPHEPEGPPRRRIRPEARQRGGWSSERAHSPDLDHRHHRVDPHRFVARRAAAPPAGALALPRSVPGERRHRDVDRARARPRLPGRVGSAGPPQPVPGGRRPRLPPSLRARVQPRGLRRDRCPSAAWSASSATRRSRSAGRCPRRRSSATSAWPSSAAGRRACLPPTSCAGWVTA